MSKLPLLEIEPKELKFIFELKKQSSCSVRLTNNTQHYVAFKVKTTSPKKYSVRPNVGVLLPNSTCEFIVTMQSQRVAPADMECKDKFLIQSTVVSAETTSEDVTSSLFVKDGSRFIEENKLKVALISSPDSPEFSPINGDFKIWLEHSEDEIQSSEPMVLKKQEHSMVNEVSRLKEDQELKPEHHMGGNTVKDVEMPTEVVVLKVSKAGELNTVKDVEELKPDKEAELKVSKAQDLNTGKNVEELKLGKGAQLLSNDLDLNKVKKVEEQKPKKEAELKLSEDQELKVLKVSKAGELNTVKDVEELKPDKEAELKVSKAQDLNTGKNVEELKLGKGAQLLSNDLDLNKVKKVEEQKPKKEAELKLSEDQELKVLKVSKAGELNTVKDVEEDKETESKVSKAQDLNAVKNVEELKLEKGAVLLSEDLDFSKVKNVDKPKPKKEAELKVSEDQELKTVKDVEELKPEKVELKVSKDLELETVKNVEELKSEKEADSKILKGVEELKLMEAIEEMKLKLDVLESKLNEAGVTISKLTEERRLSNQDTTILQDKLADFIKRSPRNVQVGFPLLYVCMVGLICVFLGYHLQC